jgi:HEPN domain-containing protein
MKGDAQREAEAWLLKADSDIQTIRILLGDPSPPLDSVCFHAQQAAEKALKGLLTAHGIPFPKTHDLALLASLIPPNAALDVPRDTWVELSYFAVGPRYPDDLTDYTRPLAEDLGEKARSICTKVRSRLVR